MLLGLDTTTERLHLALVEGPQAWCRTVLVPKGQSQSHLLLPAIDELLQQAERTAKALTGVVCCVGPGGFTSLRIGVATAEGLALTGLSTWGFSAFELRNKALRIKDHSDSAWILLDGQRQEAFAQKWDNIPLSPAEKHPMVRLSDLVQNDPWWAPLPFRERASALLSHPPLAMADEENATLQALAELCREKSQLPPEPMLVPFYLRETDAEVNFPEASLHLSEALRRGHAR